MSSNTSRMVLVLGAALGLGAGAQTTGSLRADFQNEVYPTAGYTGNTDVTITVQDERQQGDENGKYHSQSELYADGFPVRQSSLIRFQMDGGQMPSTANILGADLEFRVTDESWTGFSIYQVLRPWDEGEATYLEPMANQAWAVPGAAGVGTDRSAVPFATFGHLDAGYSPIAVTSAGVDLIRKWIDGTVPNNGLIVQDYDSWDKLGWGSANSAEPPRLVIYSTTLTVLPAVEDTMIGYQPRDSFDGWGLGFIGRPSGLTSSLVRWDLSAIPPGVKVTSAGILFTVNRLAASTGAPPVDVYPALVPWTEQANWQTYDGTNGWDSQGAQGLDTDHGTKKASLPTTCTLPDTACPLTFNSELLLLLQKWVDDPSSNHGLLLQSYTNGDDLQLIDSEWPAPGRRPKMTVQFTWDAGRPPGLYPAYAEVYPGERVSMKAFGGAGAYAYSVSGISGATIDPASGLYMAGLFAGQDQVRVVDQGGAGASAYATIMVLNTGDGGSPISISFPDPGSPVPPQGNFAVVAHISSRAVSPVSGLVLELTGQALNPEGATLVGGGRLTGTLDSGFLLPVIDTGATLQVSITGAIRAVPADHPSVTAAVRSGPLVVAMATTEIPMDPPAAIDTSCGCGSTPGGMGAVVLLAGIAQWVARRRSSLLRG